ncbi:HEAT repeat domain-containing protein [Streptomyces winkii]|uniref:HEAT repeat domain-containing protein n=1 Tax=Streptomyces winkii TaxID=3051178 RepID=UPI0028D58D99|nr:HEAT repeat domain-containing protein [Streptomyces sp. DSM 40971]
MFVDSVDSDIAPSGTLLGLLQRGRGDGTLHALAAPRAEALAALRQCVLHDPRRDWQIEHRSLYYARLHMELDASLDDIEEHLFAPEDGLPSAGDCEMRTGLALSVLGHLASYENAGATRLLRRYATSGANWQWALDELAVRDEDEGLRGLGPAVLSRFPHTAEGDAELAAAARDAFEPRPWRLWAEDPARPEQAERLRRVREAGCFDRWQRQLHAQGPRPGWSVREVLDWAQDGYEQHPRVSREAAAARCLSAVAAPEDRAELLDAARGQREAARAAALRHLAGHGDPDALDLIELAAAEPSETVAEAALCAFARMRSTAAVVRARQWVSAPAGSLPARLTTVAAEMLACCGAAQDAEAVLGALRRTVREEGPDSDELWPLVDGVGRLGVECAAPVLRHIYRETASSQLRGRAAGALALTDPSFAAGFAVECLWDCEETTRAVAAEYAATGDERVVERLRRLAADPAEEAGVQSAVRGRLSPGTGAEAGR